MKSLIAWFSRKTSTREEQELRAAMQRFVRAVESVRAAHMELNHG